MQKPITHGKSQDKVTIMLLELSVLEHSYIAK